MCAQAYAEHFGLYASIKFNCRLVSLKPDNSHRYVVAFSNTQVVVCAVHGAASALHYATPSHTTQHNTT